MLWKILGAFVNRQSKFMCLLPNFKIPKILHVGNNLRNDGSCGWRIADGENYFYENAVPIRIFLNRAGDAPCPVPITCWG